MSSYKGQVLFKYTNPEGGVKCLQNRQIKVTPPHHLNDPFEFFPRVEGTYTDTEIQQDLQNQQVRKLAWVALKQEGVVDFSFEDFEYNFADYKAEVTRYLKETWPTKTERTAKNVARMVGANWGIYCLSASCTQQLMWSHYADGHKGLVLGIDADILCDSQHQPLPVKYDPQRAPLNHRFNLDPALYEQSIFGLITTKSNDWSYEEEYRVLFGLEECSRVECPEAPLYLYNIDPSVIVEVILGSKISKDTASLVLSELRKPHFQHVKIEHCVLHKDAFSVDLCPISLEELEDRIAETKGPLNPMLPEGVEEDNTLPSRSSVSSPAV